jgi:hypothetical protein
MNKTFIIDLETLGTRPGSIIPVLAAVEIDLDRRSPAVSSYYSLISISSCIDAGLRLDYETLKWWLGQAHAPFGEVFTPDSERRPLREVLEGFAVYLGPQPIVYGNGPTFDLGLLAAAYDACKLPLPWQYRHERCLRTEKAAILRAGGKWERVTNPQLHHARFDASCEAQEFINALNTLEWPEAAA